MGVLADRLSSMTVRAISSDQQITAQLSDGDQVEFRFSRGSYARYREQALERQLSSLINGLWTGQRRGRFQALSEVHGRTIREDAVEPDPRRRRFKEAKSQITANGRSPRGYIHIETTALTTWRLLIGPGALSQLSEQHFIAELNAALRETLSDYRAKMVALKDKYFDLELHKEKRKSWLRR